MRFQDPEWDKHQAWHGQNPDPTCHYCMANADEPINEEEDAE